MNNPYESTELLEQYLAFHYGDTYFGVDHYAVRCAQLCLDFAHNRPRRVALDLGCAVGRSTFELAQGFDSVTGVDLSHRFIDTCSRLQRGETLAYWEQDEGQLGRQREVCLKTTALWPAAGNVRFVQGDACVKAIDEPLADLVFAGNLIDRVSKPQAFLQGLKNRIAPGGLLVISSPYTLLPEYTPVENWIGGRQIDGKTVSMHQGIRATLKPAFREVCEPLDVPFVIRETARKFQHSVAQMTVWERV